jgi:hypothetical protein
MTCDLIFVLMTSELVILARAYNLLLLEILIPFHHVYIRVPGYLLLQFFVKLTVMELKKSQT